MAEITDTLQQSTLQLLFDALDPTCMILSHNLNSDEPLPLELTAGSYIIERGLRYSDYAELRESKLRMKNARPQEPEEHELKITPQKKQVRFQASLDHWRKGSSVLAQSVPDFPAALRKENRKPTTTLPSMLEMTPPSRNRSKAGYMSNSRGSKSVNAGDKGSYGGGLMARKSYANVEELKGLSSAAANAINFKNRGRAAGQTVLGYRQF